jgi:hypothetical protein
MKIDFKLLIKESGEDLTQSDLAREMVKAGIFENKHSAINMMQYHQSGKAKGCDWELLKYLAKRFNRKGSEIIQWD